MKVSDILDMAFDMGFERPHIATAGEWDGGRIHILTYGPLAYRKTLEIKAPARKEEVEALMQEALAPPVQKPAVSIPVPAQPSKTARRKNATA